MNPGKFIQSAFILDLRSLAVMRILVSLIILFDLCLTRCRFLTLFYTDEGALPRKALLTLYNNKIPFSLHTATGSPAGEAILLAIAAFFALNMLIGHKTKLFTFLSWLMLLSLDHRNPFIMSGDFYLLIILFWGMFLPWGERLSVDHPHENTSQTVSSLSTSAFILQILFIYTFVGIKKYLSGGWQDGNAIYFALSLNQMNKPFSLLLLHYPKVLSFMTKLVLYQEIFIPYLFLIPFLNYRIRFAALLAFIALHIMIWLTLDTGYLSPISIAALIGMIPSFLWDKNPRALAVVDSTISFLKQNFKLPSRHFQQSSHLKSFLQKMASVCVIFFIFYSFISNLDNIGVKIRIIPKQIQNLIGYIYFDHHWGMFAPPPARSYWYLLEGTLNNGYQIDILDGLPNDYKKPPEMNKFFKEEALQKFLLFIKMPSGKRGLDSRYWSNYLCRKWNREHLKSGQLKSIRLIRKSFPITPYKKSTPVEEIAIFNYQCLD